jgi:L-malate glycosyltransferase
VGDTDSQARRVVELLSDEDRCEKMSAAARRTAESRFSTSLIIPQYEAYYDEVCRC